MRLARTYIAALAFLTVACLCCAAAPGAPAAAKPFDGNWWLAASQRQRLGYMEGDNDCSVFEWQGRAVAWDVFKTYQEFVTQYYAIDASHRSQSVFAVLRLADARIHTKTHDGDLPSEPHGDYDGLFWRESFDHERLGFVQGYLQCYAHKTEGRATFSKSPQEYVTALNTWYHLKDAERDVDPKFENVKIADALFKFRDRKGLGRFFSR